jgi:hypothetical protein
MTKTEMLHAGLARLAEKLDAQWAVAQADKAARCEGGELSVTGGQMDATPFECSYEGMCVALVTMGGEWKRDAAGHHWVYLCGQSATAEALHD